MMLLVCIPMMRTRHRDDGSDDRDGAGELVELREEIARLKAERTREKTEAVDG